MKYLAVLLVIALGFAGYRAHLQKLKETEDTAELTAYNQTKTQIDHERAARSEEERIAAVKKAEEARKEAEARERRPPMALAKALEPYVLQLEAPLNIEVPVDYVPMMQEVKSRVLEHRPDAEPGRVVVFDRATVVLNYLASLADERTKALKSMLRNKAGSTTALATTGLANSDSAGFFNQSVKKHWDETVGRARPVVAQLQDQLRAAEREWNKVARQNGAPEEYELASIVAVTLPVDPATETSPFGRSAATPVSRVGRSMGNLGGKSGMQRGPFVP